MKHNSFLLLTLIIIGATLCLFMVYSKKYKEGFLDSRCAQYKDCSTCANASGCSWCPKDNICLSSTSLKSTDKNCNQSNVISSSFNCKTGITVENDSIKSDTEQYDFAAFKSRIANKIPPPNTYTTEKIKYSNEDVVSNMNDVRNSIGNLRLDLPTIITSSMENGIKPMVKGVLSQNFADMENFADIQGYATINDNKQSPFIYDKSSSSQKVKDKSDCNKRKSCSECTDSTKCGWDPLKLQCDIQSSDKRTNITQKSRCTVTPSTINLMRTSPN